MQTTTSVAGTCYEPRVREFTTLNGSGHRIGGWFAGADATSKWSIEGIHMCSVQIEGGNESKYKPYSNADIM
jgi:hypothetical protein